MRSRSFPRLSFLRSTLPVLLLLTAPVLSEAAVQSRISSVNAESRIPLQHTVSPRALAGTDLGVAPSSSKLTSLTLFFNRTTAQQATLDQLLIDLQNPSSPRYHQWLTPEQFGAQFGISSQDLAKVTSWLTSQGFAITGTARGSNFITFSGTAGQVQQAFSTSMRSVLVDGVAHVANMTEPSLPAGIAGVVSSLTGLNDIKLTSRVRVRQVPGSSVAQPNAVHPQFTSSSTGSHYVTPGDFYKIYDVNPLITGGTTGSGVTIAVMGQTDISISDVTAFRTAASASSTNFPTANFPVANVPSVYCIKTNAAGTVTSAGIVTSPANAPSCVGSSAGDLAEAQLDVEWSGAVAPGATILYVNSTDVLNTSLVQAINQNLAPILSISYGLCEPNGGAAGLASYSQLFQQANAQGQTIVGPAGDSGATDCDYNSFSAVQGLAVDFPASSPNVTAVGGTMFSEGSGNYWQAASGSDVISSALSYIPEAVWNETTATDGIGAGGGGASKLFGKPTWQTGAGVPADSARDVPDLSLNAASGHDGYLFCSSGSCTSGFRNSAGSLNVVGGTSAGAPTFAGILALIQQKIGSKIGNANPTIYGLANSAQYGSVFHDVITGNNNSPCVTGTTDCAGGGSIGYNATTNYDLATGWGSVDAANMATYWTSITPAGVINATTKTASSVLVTTSTSACAVSTGSLIVNVSVGSSTTTVTTIPTGTVQILIDGKIVAGTIASVATLDSSGKATITVNTATLTSGPHTISASYSGDGTYTSSQGLLGTTASNGAFTSTPIDVIASTADFSLTPCTAAVAVVRGGTAQGIVLTLKSFNNFSGAVTLALDSPDAVAASYQLTNSSSTVNLTAGGTGTTTLTLFAYQSNATTATGKLKMLTSANRHPFSGIPWYAPTSGATVACLLLISLPRRRRLGGLLAVLLSVAAIGAVGCSSSSNTGTSSGGGGSTGTNTNALPGTYTLIVTATGTGGQVHTTNVTFTVQ